MVRKSGQTSRDRAIQLVVDKAERVSLQHRCHVLCHLQKDFWKIATCEDVRIMIEKARIRIRIRIRIE